MAVEQVTYQPATLGEGPCWFARQSVLFWVDILGKAVHRFDPASGRDESISVPEMVGTVAPRSDGRLLIALQQGFAVLDPQTHRIERLGEIEPDPQTRFNDGKCDPAGRFWCGSMDLQEQRPIGNLYRMDAEGQVEKVLEAVTISNGMGWSPDGRTMYYIDSPTRSIFAFDFDGASGAISNRRVAVQLNEGDGWPDGMTMDQEGKIWLSQWSAGRVGRWDPQTGRQLQRLDVPAPNTSACCFGGQDLRDLYITTAREGLTPEQLRDYPQSGCLFRLRTQVSGAPTYEYRVAERPE